ncbi:nuclear transport factor 2 family protein [Nocardia sp. CDC159]|uniref:Nuclear transport factor 2 family protein n=1 Tax=Nocardia pulmonis TaxID=2951408 RepID=A0A9X2E2W6_9NOCA|nr:MULTISPECIES: nuclear transport factor 2 family protein [Nocardia]MCM6771855.1 nuclear transport factor 2 family protein [Nocardia pulmonis]MCM6785487.1 nuclear transport factor 2 family protein [Nocardia sp. CDC159]
MSAVVGEKTYEEICAEVGRFYARHTQLMDEGRAEDAAATFTEEASMVSPPKISTPIVGRAALAEALRRNADQLAAEGIQYRRCYSMILVEVRDDGSIFARSYVQVVKTERGTGSQLHAMCVCEDVLVRTAGELRVAERVVTRDDSI